MGNKSCSSLDCNADLALGGVSISARTHGQCSANREHHIWHCICVAQSASLTAKQEKLSLFFPPLS